MILSIQALFQPNGKTQKLGGGYEGNVTPRDDVSIIKHGLRIPTDVGEYKEFVAEIKNSEEEFVKIFEQS